MAEFAILLAELIVLLDAMHDDHPEHPYPDKSELYSIIDKLSELASNLEERVENLEGY